MVATRIQRCCRFLGALSAMWVITTSGLLGQTFVQLTDLGQGIGSRLTRTDAQQRLGISLFGEIGTKVSYIDFGTVYQLGSDVAWGRILTGRMDYWVNAFDNRTGPGGRLRTPMGVDISAQKRVYAADRAGGRLLVTRFDPVAKNLVNPSSWTSMHFSRPIEAAWDGQTAPMTLEYLYVVDDSLSRVTYWDLNGGVPGSLLWSYGSVGSGTNQFNRPSGLCVGKTAAASGGTQFTTSVYVVDRGNRRVVWLTRNASGLTWNSAVALATWDPTDCAVDHFGNLYVTDQKSHRIHKFNSVLWHITTYGTYGREPSLNTFAFPKAISVPCGLKTVSGGGSVWYCEGRIVTAESWTDSSGAVEHYLGVDGSFLGPVEAPPKTGWASVSYTTTEVAYHTVTVYQVGVGTIKTLATSQLRGAGGGWAVHWDGTKADGTRADDANYQLRVALASAYTECTGAGCSKLLNTPTFYFDNCLPGGGGPVLAVRNSGTVGGLMLAGGNQEQCTGGAASPPPPKESEISAPFLTQRVTTGPEPLTRVQAGLQATTSSNTQEPAAAPLSEMVRRHGVRGVRFGVPRTLDGSQVTIRVYSISGRLIRTLVNEPLQAGIYDLSWDGLDDRGQQAAPGIYTVTLATGSFRGSKRLMLRQPS